MPLSDLVSSSAAPFSDCQYSEDATHILNAFHHGDHEDVENAILTENDTLDSWHRRLADTSHRGIREALKKSL